MPSVFKCVKGGAQLILIAFRRGHEFYLTVPYCIMLMMAPF